MEPTEALMTKIDRYFDNKSILDKYKKLTDEDNKEIKEEMKKLDITELETETHIAKITIQKRESFNETKLLKTIKELGVEGIIKTVEVVDLEKLEDAIYNDRIDATKLMPCKETKEVVTLKVTERK